MKQAVIIAGGKGERLRPLTSEMPKSMITIVDDKPLLWFMLSWLRSHGIEHVAIACGYLHEVIQRYFGDGQCLGLKIDYLIEDKPLGRGGALKKALSHLKPGEPVLAMNGDFISDLDLSALYSFHLDQKCLATIVVTPLVSPYGIVDIEGPKVTRFTEKPRLPYWVNAGIYVLTPEVVEYLPDVGDLEVETLPQLADRGQLRAFASEAFWKGIDTVKDLSDIRAQAPLVLHKFRQTT